MSQTRTFENIYMRYHKPLLFDATGDGPPSERRAILHFLSLKFKVILFDVFHLHRPELHRWL